MEDQQNQKNQQIVKTRDDTGYVALEQQQGKDKPSFKLKEGILCSWEKYGDEINSTMESIVKQIESLSGKYF